MAALITFVPKWRELAIHESSPGFDAVSPKLAAQCRHYVASQYDPSVPFGTVVATKLPCNSYVSQDLEQQTFANESFDVVLAQDVFEHIFHPHQAIKEIARTLKPGGLFLATLPIVRKQLPSRRRARMHNGTLEHLLQAEYHGNPMDEERGALVTIDWGYDIAAYLQHHSALSCILLQIDDIDRGIRADLNDVLVCSKRPLPAI